LNADGTRDTTFNASADGTVHALAAQVDGKIVAGGSFSQLNGQSRRCLGRLHADGRLDSAFPDPGILFSPAAGAAVRSLAIQPDGKTLVGGFFDRVGGAARFNLARLNPDGSVDAGFAPGASASVHSLAVQADGKILAGGSFTTLAGQPRNRLGRLYPDGSLDATLNPGAGWRVSCTVVQPDGKILVGGGFTAIGGISRSCIARLWPDGTVDGGFDPGANDHVACLAVQPDGKILVAGYFTAIGGSRRSRIARLWPDGTVEGDFDPGVTFSPDSPSAHVQSLALQTDGKIVVGGWFTTLGGQPRNHIGRLNADGTVDNGFNAEVNYTVRVVAVQPDGKILVVGNFTVLSGQLRTLIGRLNADGSPDDSFNPGPNNWVHTLALQADGKILIGGDFTVVGGTSRNRIARLMPDGTVEGGFDPGADHPLQNIAVQADGRILIGGRFSTLGGQPRSRIGRLNADGTVDNNFNPGASLEDSPATAVVYNLALQGDGKILVSGEFNTLGGVTRPYLGRLTSGSAAFQKLEINTGGTIAVWSRSGTGPEIEQVTFEQSADRTNYTLLGSATRIPGGWELAGLSLPLGQSFYLRARGRTTGGLYNGSSGLIESVALFWPLPPPFIASVQVLGGGAFAFSFTNTNAVAFTVLASTNVALPSEQWEVLGTPAPVGGDLYQFTDPGATNHARRFYQLRGP
jgi:uncharacterized delta-60 repeat protein